MTDDTILGQYGFQVVLPERVLVCARCRVTLRRQLRPVIQHLTDKHNTIGSWNLQLIESQLDQLRLEDSTGLTPRQDGSLAVDDLPTTWGFACHGCTPSYRTSSQQLLKRHISSQHGRTWAQTREGAHYERVRLQQWSHRAGPQALWWIVQRDPATDSAKPHRAPEGSDDRRRKKVQTRQHRARQSGPVVWSDSPLVSSVIAREGVRPRELGSSSAAADTAPADPIFASQWLVRTQWPATFPYQRRQRLVALTQLPNPQTRRMGLRLPTSRDEPLIISSPEDEIKITKILTAVDRMMDQGEQMVRSASRSVLCWLRSTRPQDPCPYPFQLVAHEATTRRYRARWKRCIAAMLRSARTSSPSSSSIPLTSVQSNLLSRAWTLIDLPSTGVRQGPMDDDEMDEAPDEASDGEDDDWEPSDDEGEAAPTAERSPADRDGHHDRSSSDCVVAWTADALTSTIQQLSASLVYHDLGGSPVNTSTLIYLTGAMGITSENFSFHPPRHFTSTVAALIYCCRLVGLQSFLLSSTAAAPAAHHLDEFHALRRRYLTFACDAPVGELFGLLLYGRKLSRADGPAFFTHWSDDGQTVIFQKHSLPLSSFRAYTDSVLRQTNELCDDLMQGWQPEHRLDQLHDHFATHHDGYSFVTERANGLATLYLQYFRRVASQGSQPIVQHDRWDHAALNDLVTRHDRFLRSLWLLFYVGCGQVPRATELSVIQVQNGPAHTRGIYLYAGRMLYLSRHHKARRANNWEFYVARSLPRRAQRSLFYYLVYIRPTIHLILRQCFNHQTLPDLLFASIPTQPRVRERHDWPTRDVSQLLRQSSQPFMNFPLGLQNCRQITIAMSERYLRPTMHFNQHQDRGGTAQPDAVFAWQSGHRLVQRHTNYGLDGAFPHHLQPHLLRLYQQASDAWHDFLGWPSNDVVEARPALHEMAADTTRPARPGFREAGSNPAAKVAQVTKQHPTEIAPDGEESESMLPARTGSITTETSDPARDEENPSAAGHHRTRTCSLQDRASVRGCQQMEARRTTHTTRLDMDEPRAACRSDTGDSASAGEQNQVDPTAPPVPWLAACHGYGTIVCCEHRTAYTPKNLKEHIVRKHRLKGLLLQEIMGWVRRREIGDTVRHPAAGAAPISGLQIYQGWQCRVSGCHFSSTSKAITMRHYGREHQLCSRRQCEQAGAPHAVSLQKWFAKSGDYFVVDPV